MKLISLYIENFGGLSQFSLDFQAGLTVIEEANGFGKTTLAEFIRAMFYGFPRKAKTLDKNRRQKYTPWNGGKFGGNLVFETGGCRYRVERTFGATPKGDSFALIDLTTGKRSSRYSEELGLELFQLDGDSFERSTYLPQLSDGLTLTTDSIHSKLSNLVEDTNDVGNFEKAIAALRAKRSTLSPYRGSGGSITQLGSRIAQLHTQLQQAKGQRDMMDDTDREIEAAVELTAQLENRREQVRREIRQAAEAAAAVAVYRQYDRLLERQRALKQEADRIREAYPKGIPGEDATEAVRQALSQIAILESRELTQQEDLDAVAFVDAHRDRFENHIPTDEELFACRSKCEVISNLREESVNLAAELTQQIPIKANPWPSILLVTLGLAGIFAGVILLLTDGGVWSYTALGVGILLMVGSIFAAVRLTNARKILKQFQREQAKTRKKLEQVSLKTEQLTREVETYLGAYVELDGSDLFGLLMRLEHCQEAYFRAMKRVSEWYQDQELHEAELSRWNDVLNRFYSRYSLIRQADVRKQLLQIRDDRKELEEIQEDQERLRMELESFRQEHQRQLEIPRPVMMGNPERLQQEEAHLNGELNRCGQRLLRLRQNRETLLTQVRQIPDLEDELRYLQEKKRADQKKSDLLDDTMAFLEQAKENLSGSYLGPIRQRFAGYLEKLWPEQEGQILVTPELQVQLERLGEVRELGYFSAGQTDTVMLCMRLALVDALFREEKPFVILDDPFINLDDVRTREALGLLKVLAKERQILYLTCNSSRVPQ